VVPDGCREVVLVEPSAALLAAAEARLAGRVLAVTGHNTTLAGYLAESPPPVDAAQATYALHTVEPGARPALLAALAERIGLLAVAEFDVPAFADRSPAHAAYAAERYPRGLAEYPEGSEVGPGFLVPVLVAQFDPARPAAHLEQPVAAWVGELDVAGYRVDYVVDLHDYWWAPARLIVARPARLAHADPRRRPAGHRGQGRHRGRRRGGPHRAAGRAPRPAQRVRRGGRLGRLTRGAAGG
jgi:hypothetical protein